MEIVYSTKYLRLFRKLQAAVKSKVSEREEIFRVDPFDPRLDTHKLHGKEMPHWAFSIDRKNRIKFLLLEGGCVEFVYVGPHDGAYK